MHRLHFCQVNLFAKPAHSPETLSVHFFVSWKINIFFVQRNVNRFHYADEKSGFFFRWMFCVIYKWSIKLLMALVQVFQLFFSESGCRTVWKTIWSISVNGKRANVIVSVKSKKFETFCRLYGHREAVETVDESMTILTFRCRSQHNTVILDAFKVIAIFFADICWRKLIRRKFKEKRENWFSSMGFAAWVFRSMCIATLTTTHRQRRLKRPCAWNFPSHCWIDAVDEQWQVARNTST